MNKQMLTTIYFLGAAIIMIGALQKILHNTNANVFLQIGFMAVVVFVGFCVYEIMQSKRIELPKKILWSVGLVCVPVIVGFVYIHSGRRRIVNT